MSKNKKKCSNNKTSEDKCEPSGGGGWGGGLGLGDASQGKEAASVKAAVDQKADECVE